MARVILVEPKADGGLAIARLDDHPWTFYGADAHHITGFELSHWRRTSDEFIVESRSATMHVNYRYMLQFAERERTRRGQSPDRYTILDYGCGAGEVVETGRERGLDLYGADVFYAGGSTRHTIEEKGLLGTLVKEIHDGNVDFPDAFFNLVVNNQVFEHVENLDRVLAEINRVLKPGGKMLSIFPSRDMVREAHCGIPFLHWFSRESKLRYPYTFVLRRIGFGLNKDERTTEEWAKYYIHWVDNYCFYRSRESILASFGRYFKNTLIEDEYIAFRLRDTRLSPLAPLSQMPVLKSLGNEFLRRFGFLVILSEKPESARVP